MQETKNQPDTPTDGKHNTGAKIGVAFAFGTVGAKLGIPAMAIDLNSIFPKGMGMVEKVKKTFSREIGPLIMQRIGHFIEKGHSELSSIVLATKWSTVVSTVGMLGLGTVGWMRADRIQNSSDIVKHPITSTKILLGMEEPEDKKPGQHAAKLLAEREQPSVEIQR